MTIYNKKIIIVWDISCDECGHDLFQGAFESLEKAVEMFPQLKDKYSTYWKEEYELDKEYI